MIIKVRAVIGLTLDGLGLALGAMVGCLERKRQLLDNAPGLAINRGFHRPSSVLIKQVHRVLTSHLANATDGQSALDDRIKPLDSVNATFVGPALRAFACSAGVASPP